MLQKLKQNTILKSLLDGRNLGLYAVAIVALSVTWSSAKAIEKNYALQKQITHIRQEVAIQEQENKNIALKNEYYKTDAYLELAARKYFGKAAAGETLLLVPRDVAKSYVHPTPAVTNDQSTSSANRIIQNWQAWMHVFVDGPGIDSSVKTP